MVYNHDLVFDIYLVGGIHLDSFVRF